MVFLLFALITLHYIVITLHYILKTCAFVSINRENIFSIINDEKRSEIVA